jgi:hypothetical protein
VQPIESFGERLGDEVDLRNESVDYDYNVATARSVRSRELMVV